MFGNLFKRLRHFDAYPKTLEDFRVKTLTGAFITAFTTAAIVILFIMEWKDYMAVEVEQELFVDLTRTHKLSINLNMTLQKLPCSLLSIDATDVSGQTSHDISGLKKTRLNSEGNFIPNEITTTQSTTTTASNSEKKKCGSCYGAENMDLNIICCNTCNDVKIAYRYKGWQFVPNIIEQCVNEHGKQEMQASFNSKEDVEKLLNKNEGCRLEGDITVNKISGNIHFAPGISFEQNHQHYHSMENLPVEKLNTDHFFEKFSFGDEYPTQFNPLEFKSLKGEMPGPENTKQGEPNQADMFAQLINFGFYPNPNLNQDIISNSKSVNYRYFLKIVPTTYEYLDGRIVNNTYQYSVTRSAKVMTQNVFGASQMPGIFVTYELSPIMIKYIERSKSFSHFITSCCAIIGGLFTIAGILDGFTFRYYNMYKKYQMNKLT